MEGSVEIIVDQPGCEPYRCIRSAPDLIGESALVPDKFRSATVIAHKGAKAILLYRDHYRRAIIDYEASLQHKYEQLLKSSDVTRDWNVLKRVNYANKAQELKFLNQATVYQLGDDIRNTYFLLEGVVQLELNILFEKIVWLPINHSSSSKNYLKKVTSQVIRRIVKVVKPGMQFGFEEIVKAD